MATASQKITLMFVELDSLHFVSYLIRFLLLILGDLIAVPIKLAPVVRIPLFIKKVDDESYLPCSTENWEY